MPGAFDTAEACSPNMTCLQRARCQRPPSLFKGAGDRPLDMLYPQDATSVANEQKVIASVRRSHIIAPASSFGLALGGLCSNQLFFRFIFIDSASELSFINDASQHPSASSPGSSVLLAAVSNATSTVISLL